MVNSIFGWIEETAIMKLARIISDSLTDFSRVHSI